MTNKPNDKKEFNLSLRDLLLEIIAENEELGERIYKIFLIEISK